MSAKARSASQLPARASARPRELAGRVLAPTKGAVIAEYHAKEKAEFASGPFVKRKAKFGFYNVSPLDMGLLIGDQDNIRANLESYVQGFDRDVRSIFEHFDFAATLGRLHKANC